MERDGENLGEKFRGCIVNFCDPDQWSRGERGEQVSSLLREAARDERVGITLGCHPHFASKMTAERWRQLRRLLSSSWLEVVALGECGLDYSRKNYCDRDLQQQVQTSPLSLVEPDYACAKVITTHLKAKIPHKIPPIRAILCLSVCCYGLIRGFHLSKALLRHGKRQKCMDALICLFMA